MGQKLNYLPLPIDIWTLGQPQLLGEGDFFLGRRDKMSFFILLYTDIGLDGGDNSSSRIMQTRRKRGNSRTKMVKKIGMLVYDSPRAGITRRII